MSGPFLGEMHEEVPPPSGIITDGLILRWPLDEGTGEIAYDTSGVGPDGDIYYLDDSSSWKDTERGKAIYLRRAISYRGGYDRIHPFSQISFENTPFSVSFFVDRLNSERGGTGRYDGDSLKGWYLYFESDNKLRVYLRKGSNDWYYDICNVINMVSGGFHHVGMAYAADGSPPLLTVDGVSYTTSPNTGGDALNGILDGDPTKFLTINDVEVAPGQKSRGYAYWSDYRLYNRALLLEEFQAISNNQG